MPIGQVGKQAEDWGSLSPEPSQTLPRWRGTTEHALDFGNLLEEFSRRISTTEVSNRESALEDALEVLAHGLLADRVSFFIAARSASPDFRTAPAAPNTPTDSREDRHYVLLSDWRREGLVAAQWVQSTPSVVDLDTLPDQGARLLRGQSLLTGAGMLQPQSSTSNEACVTTSWSRLRPILYLPCVGPSGLVGIFAVENGLLSHDGHGGSWSALQQASLVGSLFASFLERRRAAIELDAIRRQIDHDAQLERLVLVACSVAHDFNNVLTAILGYADLASLEIPEHGPGQQELAEIRNAATRAANLVEQVLSPSRHSHAEAKRIDLSEFVDHLGGMLRRVVGETVKVEFDLPDQLDAVMVDSHRLERALLNLASNARDAISAESGDAGRFELSTASVQISKPCSIFADPEPGRPVHADLEQGRYVRLSVADNGCGIDPSIQERIFDRFFTTRDRGTGLGLAAVAELMDDVGGAIRVESALDDGTTFHLYFPVDPIHPIDPPAPD